MELALQLIAAFAPVLVALVGTIPAILSTKKSTRGGLEKVQATLEAHIREDEDDKARNQRYRILRFYDEMCEQRDHSESHFEDILDDIDSYEHYCDAHPDFKNNRGKVAMAYIKEQYAAIKSRGGFLTHKKEGD